MWSKFPRAALDMRQDGYYATTYADVLRDLAVAEGTTRSAASGADVLLLFAKDAEGRNPIAEADAVERGARPAGSRLQRVDGLAGGLHELKAGFGLLRIRGSLR